MQIKTILNRIEKYQSFVYGDPVLLEKAHQLILEVPIQPRANSRPICSECGHRRPGYEGYVPVLKGSRWWLLKRPENLTDRQATSLRQLLQYNLRTVRSYLLKEDFQFFWECQSLHWAGVFLDDWCGRVIRSRLEPLKKVARMLGGHRDLILNWFHAKKAFSSGVVEGLNGKAKATMRNAYGFRTYKTLEMALYHSLGALPEPQFTHSFF